MARALTLENFTPNGLATGLGDSEVILGADARLAAYEDGYKAGWDDSVAAESQTQTRVGADFAHSLQELSFTFHEARAHVLGSIAPLLTLMAEKVLPDLARDGFAQSIIELAREAATEAANRPIELVINPANRPAVERLLEGDPGLPLTVVEEPTLGPGQAFLRGARGETSLDLDAVTAGIRDAVSGFLATETQLEVHDHG